MTGTAAGACRRSLRSEWRISRSNYFENERLAELWLYQAHSVTNGVFDLKSKFLQKLIPVILISGDSDDIILTPGIA